MKNALIGLLLCGLFAPLLAQADVYEEGRNYTRIVPAQPTDTSNKIEVVELFWYGCPHCYRFQPFIERWSKKKAADIEYRRMPAIFREDWAILARAYYTAEALGIVEKTHQPLFDAIHAQKRRLDTEDQLAAFFVEHGVKEDDFRKAFHSFAVEAKVKRSKEMSVRYRAEATPSIVVNGKYIMNPDQAGKSLNDMLKVVDFLVEKERAARTQR